jgi:homoserine dehydrogenase
MKSINVGLLGIGTVGGGTFAVLARNQEEIARRGQRHHDEDRGRQGPRAGAEHRR